MRSPVIGTFPPRSYLFAPADDERLLGKVFHAGADAVVLDLEDAVLPERKPMARELLARKLATVASPSPAVFVRINPVGGSDWRQDVAAAVAPVTRGVRIAKTQSVCDVLAVSQALAEAEARAALPVGGTQIVPTIESAAGVLAAAEIAKCARVAALCFGATDFLNDIGGEADELNVATLHAESHLVVVSAASGLLPPIASVHTDLADMEGLRTSTLLARKLGFFGRSCIHPKQLRVIHEVFSPSPQQVEGARRIVAAAATGARSGRGAVTTEAGQFVDTAVVARARRILALAEQIAARAGAESP